MINATDRKRIVKASQTANLLVSDLRALVNSPNPLLADIALEVLQKVVEVETKLKRIEGITQT